MSDPLSACIAVSHLRHYMFHVVSASTALQTISEILLQSLRFCAFDLICSKSSFVFKIRISKTLFIDLDLMMSLFNVVTMLSRGLPLNPFSDRSK